MSRRRSSPKIAAVIAAAATLGKGQRVGKSFEELREIEKLMAVAAKYDGPVRRCPPGVARAHETKVVYMPPKDVVGCLVQPDGVGMRRRLVITLLGGAAAWPIAAFAQQRLPRIGVLLNGRAVPSRDLQIAADLARIGYVEGSNIAYEVRGADHDIARLPPLARELAAMRPEVLVGSTAQVAVALINATREIPIVVTVISDPIALGLSTSISHPTRNVTGFTISSPSLAGKRLAILHEVVPASSKVAYLWAGQNPSAQLYKSNVQQAAEVLGIKLVLLPLTSEKDIVGAFTHADEEKVTAVLVEASPLTYRLSGSIVDQCLIRNLPAMHCWSIEVRNGALMSYGPAEPENNAQAAVYVARILKGAKVAELPFEEPTEIKLVINLRTARSIGLALSPAFIARADEVIE